jgi:hypothetical protein
MELANRIKIYDNFLDPETFMDLRDITYGDDLRWKSQISDGLQSNYTRFDMGDMIRVKNDWVLVGDHPFFNKTLYSHIQKVLPDPYIPSRTMIRSLEGSHTSMKMT